MELPPYVYEKLSGPGSIELNSGLFRSGDGWDPTTVKVTDSKGKSAEFMVTNIPTVVDGTVNAIARDGSFAFLGGAFSRTNPDHHQGFVYLNNDGTKSLNQCNTKGKIFSNLAFIGITKSITIGNSTYFARTPGSASFDSDPISGLFKVNNTTCELDKTFNQIAQTLANDGFILDLEIDVSTNSLYVAGEFSSYAGESVSHLIKIDMDTAALDRNFLLNGANSYINNIALSGDSLYLVGSSITSYNGYGMQKLAKVSKLTGQIDTVFTQSTGVWASCDTTDLLILGSSLYAGLRCSTPRYRGVITSQVLKLDLITGNLDATFSANPAFGLPAKAESLATDGINIFVGGEFSTYRGVSTGQVIKLNATTGVRDAGFQYGTGATGSSSFFLSFDPISQDLLIISSGQNYNTVATGPFLRVNKDTGAPDLTFNSNLILSTSAQISDFNFLNDGRILANYTGKSVGGSIANNIAKIDLETGRADTNFSS